ncbi:hypothetical protein Aperf_G00000047806 [Anoplocephala perfoliata]
MLEELNLDDNKLAKAGDIANLALLPKTPCHKNTKSMKSPITCCESVEPNLIFPKLVYLDMSENVLNCEEGILTTMVCPSLKNLKIFGNPLVEHYSKAPPRVKAILIETLGVSIECERSEAWGCNIAKSGFTRSKQRRKDHLPPLKRDVKDDKTGITEDAVFGGEGNLEFDVYPLQSQLDTEIDYTDLSKDIQRCLNEFKTMKVNDDGGNKEFSYDFENEGGNKESSNYSTPNRNRTIEEDAKSDVSDRSEVKISNPYINGISELPNKDYSCHKPKKQQLLSFHLKVCSLLKAEEEKRKKDRAKIMGRQNRGPTRPPGRFCYICGRLYTKSSWQWHESKCQERWNAWNDRLPKELQHHGGIIKPDISEEAISCVLEKEKAAGNATFTRTDAIDKINIETSCINALPI